MAHCITGVVTTENIAAQIAREAGSPVPTALHQDFFIVPLGDGQLDAWLPGGFENCAEGFTYLSPALERKLAGLANKSQMAYIETEYHGGTGYQAAALFRNGALVSRHAGELNAPISRKSPINTALREMGVRADDRWDEFDTLGLGGFRSLSSLGVEY